MKKKNMVCALVIIICILGGILFSSIENPHKNNTEDDFIKLKTSYCELSLPKSFEGNIESEVISEEPYIVEFKTTDGQKVFELKFGEKTEALLGTLVLENQNIPIYVEMQELDTNDPRYNELVEYQNSINGIVNQLEKDYEFIAKEEIKDEDKTGTFDIKTSVATFKYPKKWENTVGITLGDKNVSFDSKGVLLFTLYFEQKEDAFLLGTYDGVPICIVSNEIDAEEFSYDEYYDLCAMQNDVNVIIDNLKNDKKFIINME